MAEQEWRVRAGLRAATTLGGFFSLDVGTPTDADPADQGWQPLAGIVDDPRLLEGRVRSTREALAATAGVPVGDIDARAAASAVQLALASRLVSPALACAAFSGSVPSLALSGLWWKPGYRNPVPLRLGEAVGADCASIVAAVEAWDSSVTGPALKPLAQAVAAVVPLSPHVVWGNVASALATAAELVGAASPDRAGWSRELVAALLETESLSGMGAYREGDGQFRRRNCCLFYRLPGRGLCGDCVLLDDPSDVSESSAASERGTV